MPKNAIRGPCLDFLDLDFDLDPFKVKLSAKHLYEIVLVKRARGVAGITIPKCIHLLSHFVICQLKGLTTSFSNERVKSPYY